MEVEKTALELDHTSHGYLLTSWMDRKEGVCPISQSSLRLRTVPSCLLCAAPMPQDREVVGLPDGEGTREFFPALVGFASSQTQSESKQSLWRC